MSATGTVLRRANVEGLESVTKLPDLARQMRARGFSVKGVMSPTGLDRRGRLRFAAFWPREEPSIDDRVRDAKA
jgi:hypothetical protein